MLRNPIVGRTGSGVRVSASFQNSAHRQQKNWGCDLSAGLTSTPGRCTVMNDTGLIVHTQYPSLSHQTVEFGTDQRKVMFSSWLFADICRQELQSHEFGEQSH